MNEEYKRLAYEQAVWRHLIDHIEDQLVGSDTAPASTVTCDDLPFKERTVPQDVIREVEERIRRFADMCRQEMSNFSMVRKNDEREPGNGRAAPTDQRPARKAPRAGKAARGDKKPAAEGG